MAAQPERKQKQRAFHDWFKAAIVTGAVMGALGLFVFVVQAIYNQIPLGLGSSYVRSSMGYLCLIIFYALMLPGAVIAFPLIKPLTHSADLTFFIVSGVLSWPFYTQIVYSVLRWRRRKREAELPPAKPEEFSYTERWQKPVTKL